MSQVVKELTFKNSLTIINILTLSTCADFAGPFLILYFMQNVSIDILMDSFNLLPNSLTDALPELALNRLPMIVYEYIKIVGMIRLPVAVLFALCGYWYTSLLYMLALLSGTVQFTGFLLGAKYLGSQLKDTNPLNIGAFMQQHQLQQQLQQLQQQLAHNPAIVPEPEQLIATVTATPAQETVDVQADAIDMIDHTVYNEGDPVFIINSDERHLIRREHAIGIFSHSGTHPLLGVPINRLEPRVIHIQAIALAPPSSLSISDSSVTASEDGDGDGDGDLSSAEFDATSTGGVIMTSTSTSTPTSVTELLRS